MVFALVIVAGTASAVGAATASWDANTEPDVAGYKLSYGTQSGVHTVVIDVGKVTTYRFYPSPGRRYYVVVQAYNIAGQLSSKSAEVVIDVPLSNLSPSLAQPANQTTTVNANASLALSASDPEGKALTFTATGLPPGLLLNSSTRLISGIPNTVGSYTVTVRVSDGLLTASRSFTWAIVANRPPVLAQPANQTSKINATVSLALSASDPEGKALQFSAIGLPTGLVINGTSGLISGIARTAGAYAVTVRATDGALWVSRSFSWSVVATSLTPMTATTSSEAGSEEVTTRASEDIVNDVANPCPVQDCVGVSGEFDGDGRPDLGTYRLSSGEWRLWTSGSNFLTATLLVWGAAGDVPLPADYNGDRVTDLGVYRPSTGTWHLWLSGSETPWTVQWGGLEDKPIALDHDMDGKADLALIRNGGYEILLSSSNYLKSVHVR